MAAITDQDELSYIQSQINDGAPPVAPAGMVVAPLNSAPITDADELAHIRSQLEAPQAPAAPAPSSAVTVAPYDGPVMESPPPKGFYQYADDVGRMMAAKLPFSDRIAAAYDSVTGKGIKGERDYSKNLQNERIQNEAIAHEYPILSKVLGYGTGAAAALATAPEAAIAAPTMIGRVGAGAAIGAAYGGIQGASDTPDLTNAGDTAKNIALGAVIGGTAGAAMPITAAGIGTAYSGAANVINGGVDGISRRAAGQLLPALAADTPAAIRAELDRLGPQGMLLDTGPAMLGRGMGASLNSDEGRAVITNALNARNAGRNGRIQDVVNNKFGQAEDPQVVRDSILAERSRVDGQNYPAAFARSGPIDASVPVASVGEMLNRAVPGTLEHKALTNLRGMLMDEREVPMMAPNGRQFTDPHGNPITETVPFPRDDPEQLHRIKGEIDNIINYDAPGLGVPAGALQRQQGALRFIRGHINDVLEQQVPGYAEANRISAGLAQRAEAVQTGTSLLDSGKTAMRPQTLEAQFNAMPIGARVALAKGARAEVDRLLSTKENDLVAGKNVIKGEGDWNRDRLATVFGPQNADAVIGTVGRESTFANSLNKIVDGSQTDIRNASRNAMKPEAATGGIPWINPNMTLAGAIATPIKAGAAAVLRSLRPDHTRAYGEIANVLSAQGPQRDAYMSALVDALMRRNTNAATGMTLGNRAAMAAALIGAPAANDRLLGRQ